MEQTMEQMLKKARKIAAFVMKEIDDARILTNAATITLFMFISIFPLLMVVMMIIPQFSITLDDVLELLGPAVPAELFPLLRVIVEDIYRKSLDGSALSINIILTLWAASSGMSWLVRGVNDVYRNHNRRSWVRNRGMSLLYTLAFIVVIVVTLLCVVFGHNVQDWLILRFPSLSAWESRVGFFQNLIASGVVIAFMTLAYQVFPRNKTFFFHQLPGAFCAAVGWYLFSAVYSFYLRSISNYSYTYGSLATIVSMIIWLFVCMIILLAGGEVNYLWAVHREKRRRRRQMESKPKKRVDNPGLCDKI